MITDPFVILAIALINLAMKMVEYLKDKWDTLHPKTEVAK